MRPAAPALLSTAILATTLLSIPPIKAQETDLEAFSDVIDVRVLNLEVAVTDKDGAHVEDLRPEDFRLTVDGNVVPIEYFSEIRFGSSIDPGAAETIEASPISTVPSVAPGKVVGTSFLLFVDDYFGVARNRKIVLENIIETIPRLGPEDRMAVVSFNGRKLELVGNWETSHPGIVRNLRKAIAAEAGGLKRRSELNSYELQLRSLGAGLIEDSLENTKVEYVRALSRQVDTVVKAATAAMRAMAMPPGRKVMLLTSGGWPDDPAQYAVGTDPDIRNRTKRYSPKPAFDDLAGTANKLGYTIYTIDMAGRNQARAGDAGNAELVGENFRQAPPDTLPDDNPGVVTNSAFGAPPPPEQVIGQLMEDVIQTFELTAGREQLVEGALIELARETGGEAMLNSFRATALPRTLEGISSYYWLGYTPSWARDDEEHKVRIEVLRPGLKTRSRRGFRDLSRKSEVTMMVESNLLFDTDLRGHSLHATLGEPKKAGGKKLELPVSLKIPLDQLLMLPVAGGFEANLELRVAVIDEKGARSEIPVIPVKLGGDTKPSPGAYATYDTTLVLRAIQQQLALVLYDVAGEKMLSTSVDFDPGSG
ncbi:MAG: VWA domain-containing protein [bacterium]|nr:VWA domain-containing protein [bacterium]